MYNNTYIYAGTNPTTCSTVDSTDNYTITGTMPLTYLNATAGTTAIYGGGYSFTVDSTSTIATTTSYIRFVPPEWAQAGDTYFGKKDKLTPDRRRARKLLRSLVGERAYRSWIRYKRLDIITEAGHRYRFKLWSTVSLMEGRRGSVALESWCIIPKEDPGAPSLNAEDRMISQILYVISNEEEARKTANVTILKKLAA